MSADAKALKPFQLYMHPFGPNPLKVRLVLSVLQLPYENIFVKHSELKTDKFTPINPNGRLPALHDPNTGLTLWESGTIIEYIVEQYDVQEPRQLSFPPRSHEDYLVRQWLCFQTSGQGPYYGQASWFKRMHHEKLPSAITRYVDEARRIMGVLDGWLATRAWLVGHRMTYADMAFIPWQRIMERHFGEEGLDGPGFPHYQAWMQRMLDLPAIGPKLAEMERDAEEAWPAMVEDLKKLHANTNQLTRA